MTADEAKQAYGEIVGTNYGRDQCHESTMRLAAEALLKEIPKPPYIQNSDRGDCYECPNCDSFIGYEYDCREEHYQDNYCPYCGQVLDWEGVSNGD